MEIKEYFNRAFSGIRNDHDLPDNKTICKDILERAKKMEKRKESRHRVFGVAGGIAGTAAVLAGAVFGVNCLNEHGALKGPDVQGGAGYHADMTAQLSADEDIAESLATFVFDGCKLNITDYDFDGISLNVYYDVIFDDSCTLSSEEKLAFVLPMIVYEEENASEGHAELISETGNTQSCVLRETLKAYTEKLYVNFILNEEGYAQTGGYPFTVYADHKETEHIEINAAGKAVNGVVPMDETAELDGVTVHFTGYEFDSEVVTFYYDVIGTTRMDIRPMGINGAVFNGTSGTPDEENSMVKDCHGTVALYERCDTARISFGKDLTDLTDKSYTTDDEAFAVTVHLDPDSVTDFGGDMINDQYKDYHGSGSVSPADLLITPTHITERLIWENGDPSKAFEVFGNKNMRVLMKDGETAEARRSSIITADDGSGIVWVTYYFDEPIDMTMVSEVNWQYGEDITILNAGDSFKLDDGATASIDEIRYDGFMLKTVISVHSDDSDYYTKKTERFGGMLFVCTDLPREWQTGVSTTANTDENGCDVIFTYYSVIPADQKRHSVKIWDDSEDKSRVAGYIGFGGSSDDAIPYTRTVHTESEEFGKRELTVSSSGFRLIQNDSDYLLDPLDNKLTTVKKDGQTIESTVTAAGEQSIPDYADYQLLFGLFDEPLDPDEIYSLNFFGETFVFEDAPAKIPEASNSAE